MTITVFRETAYTPHRRREGQLAHDPKPRHAIGLTPGLGWGGTMC
jgi:hypothetical protein